MPEHQSSRQASDSIQRWPVVKGRVGDPDASTVWRWERDGLFPKRIKLGPHAVGWLESEVDAWIAKRAGNR